MISVLRISANNFFINCLKLKPNCQIFIFYTHIHTKYFLVRKLDSIAFKLIESSDRLTVFWWNRKLPDRRSVPLRIFAGANSTWRPSQPPRLDNSDSSATGCTCNKTNALIYCNIHTSREHEWAWRQNLFFLVNWTKLYGHPRATHAKQLSERKPWNKFIKVL